MIDANRAGRKRIGTGFAPETIKPKILCLIIIVAFNKLSEAGLYAYFSAMSPSALSHAPFLYHSNNSHIYKHGRLKKNFNLFVLFNIYSTDAVLMGFLLPYFTPNANDILRSKQTLRLSKGLPNKVALLAFSNLI